MIIVNGATGQVGTHIVECLEKEGLPIRALVRDVKKALKFRDVEIQQGDLFDSESLKRAFKSGDTAFILTPEDPQWQDSLSEIETMLYNYREAIRLAGIKKVVGLSSMGAQQASDSGYLQFSYMVENFLEGLPLQKVFIRPAYYLSNWLPYLNIAKQQGILPTFLPPERKIMMVAPQDAANFICSIISRQDFSRKVYEITGPRSYSSKEIAEIIGNQLNSKVEAVQIPPGQWINSLMEAGLSEDAAEKIAQMTHALIDGRAEPEGDPIKLKTTAEEFFGNKIQ